VSLVCTCTCAGGLDREREIEDEECVFWRFMIHGIRAEHKDRYGDPVTWIKMDNMDKSIKK